jgi:hypothetical protein
VELGAVFIDDEAAVALACVGLRPFRGESRLQAPDVSEPAVEEGAGSIRE